jgi:predicted nuclease of predicted toxin-antitoxin system
LKIVADESVEGPTVSALRAAGHQVLFIAETSPGIEDAEVLGIARPEKALLLTADKDFGELVFRNRETHSGILEVLELKELGFLLTAAQPAPTPMTS